MATVPVTKPLGFTGVGGTMEDYNNVKYEAPNTSPDSIAAGKTKGGTMSMSWVFFKEIQDLFSMPKPLHFDTGIITEVVGGGKYKIKLSGGSVITATSSLEEMKNSSYRASVSQYLKGALALVICINDNPMEKNSPTTYVIWSVRQTGQFAPNPEEYPV